MIRFFALAWMLMSMPAWASWEFSGQGAFGEQGAATVGEVQYSPQGFWAVGALAHINDELSVHPQLGFRASFELLKWVPRLTLRTGLYGGLTWGVDGGFDYFFGRQMSVRTRLGWGTKEGFEGGLGLAWFPFD